jgi:hypothetical protein
VVVLLLLLLLRWWLRLLPPTASGAGVAAAAATGSGRGGQEIADAEVVDCVVLVCVCVCVCVCVGMIANEMRRPSILIKQHKDKENASNKRTRSPININKTQTQNHKTLKHALTAKVHGVAALAGRLDQGGEAEIRAVGACLGP